MGERGHDEFERSYDVGEALAVPSLLGAAGVERLEGPEDLELDAVYFDTADLALARSRVALRHRTGGADAGWHVKRATEDGRREQQWPSAGEARGVPAEVRAAIAELAGGRELRPVARVRNSRRVWRLRRGDGVAVAEFCDDRVVATRPGDPRESRWREWEVELMAGIAGADGAERDRVLDAIEDRLLAAGAVPSASGSKLARALGDSPDRRATTGTERRAARKRERA